MKNNKQLQNNKKHKALRLGLGLGLASSVAISTAAFAITLNRNSESLVNKVKFVAGAGHTFKANGASLTMNLKKDAQLVSILPTDTLVSTGNATACQDFVGWAKSSDFKNGKIEMKNVLSTYSYVQPSTELTAVYTSNVINATEWHKITFSKGNEEVILTGNTVINVLLGTQFQSINKPGCEPKATGGAYKCVGWYINGDKTKEIQPTDPITADMTTFTPKMSAASTITFAPSAIDEGAKIIGTADVACANGTKFGNINIPKVDYTNCSSKRVFLGWYKVDQQWTAANQYSATTEINGNLQAFARSAAASSKDFAFFEAVQPEGVTVEYQGNTEFAAPAGAKWGTFNVPIPIVSELTVSKWEWSNKKTGGTWQEVTTGQTFAGETTTYLRPVMSSSITSVRVATEKTPYIAKDCKTKLYAEVLPKESDQSVSWEVFEDSEGNTPLDGEYGSIDIDGNLIINSNYWADEVYVRATAKKAPTVKSEITKIEIKLPIVSNNQIWTFDETDSSWYRLENVCSQSGDIEYYKYGSVSKAKSVKREEFDADIYFGDKVDRIDNNFLYGCKKFNSDLIPGGYIRYVGNNFLYGCTSFNNKGVDMFVAPLYEIGDNFMNGCVAFNNKESTNTINLESIKTIGNGLLYGCEKFNSPVVFGPNLTRIGDGCFEKCYSFNNGNYSENTYPFIIPSNIQSIGSHFLAECESFTSTIQFNCEAKVFATGGEINTLSTTNSNAPLAKTGFNVTGTNATSFPFRTITDYQGYYRTVTISEWTVTSVKINLEESSQEKTFSVGDYFSSSGLRLDVTYTKQDGTTKTETVSAGFITDPAEGYEFTSEDVGQMIVYVGFEGKEAGSYKIEVQEE